MSPIVEGRPDLEGPRNYRWLSHEGAGEYQVAMGLLAEGLPDVYAQHRVGRLSIDVACWPVAYEVWSSSNLPHNQPRQRQKIIELIGAGWTVCYIHLHRGEHGCIDGQIFPALARLFHIATAGGAPGYVRVKHREFTSGWLEDGDLVVGTWPDNPWAAVVAAQAHSEWERRDLKRRDALRRRYWLNKYGIEPPPRGQRKRRMPPSA